MTVIVVGVFLDPVLQGFYYTFGSILAASMFFEAGVGTAIVQFAAHESGQVKIVGRKLIGGSEVALRRLAAVLRFALTWFWSVAGIMGLAIGFGGAIILSQQQTNVDWQAPWVLLIAVVAGGFALQPFFAFLEGSGRLRFTYMFRTVRSLLQSSVLIVSVIAGAELYSLAIANAAAVLLALCFLIPNTRFFLSVSAHFRKGSLDWRREVLPFQWRLAVAWGAGYLTVSAFTPTLMVVRGPIEAGQIGMSVTLMVACTSVAASFMQAHAPGLGELAGRREWGSMLTLFRSKAVTSLVVCLFLLTTLLAAVAVGDNFGIALVDRLAPLGALALLAVGFLAYHAEGVMAFYMRAQKREPYYVLEIIGALLIFPSTLVLGSLWGVGGVALGFALTHIAILLPIAFWILRKSIKANRLQANLQASP